jgi:carbon-monoxide dehydrogenase large subunit
MIPQSDRALDGVKFAVGQPVLRKEDPTLVRGEGQYADDVSLDGQVYVAMVRSPVAHGFVRSIDIESARAMDGVLGVWTGADIKAAGYSAMPNRIPFKNRDGSPNLTPDRHVLAIEKVRFVGDPVAFVVATSTAIAKSAAEAVMVDIDSLPAVVEMADAVKPGAPQLYDGVPQNTTIDFHHGDTAATEAAFAGAAHVARVSLTDPRIVINPMELRSCLADYDAAREHWTLRIPTQGVFGYRNQTAEMLGVAPEKVTILTGHVGGSFGMRGQIFPEYVCALHATRVLGRPVKWTEERTPSFLSDSHGRAQQYEAEIALDEAGHFLAVRVNGFGDMGAYLTSMAMMPSTRNIVVNICSMYRLPLLEVSMRCVLTNKSPIGAYRGAGRPEANYVMERLVDAAAVVSGIDRVELRRINQLLPSELPYKAQSGMVVDSGDFTGLMDRALAAADVAGFPARRDASARDGKLRGLGIGCFLEATGGGTKEMAGIRFENDGSVTLVSGTLDYGQGHASSFAQVLSERLGIPFESINLLQGDSDQLIYGGGTGGSKSMIAAGTAIVAASEKLVEQAKPLAAWALNSAPEDVRFTEGRFVVDGGDRAIDLMTLASRVREVQSLPESLPKSLDIALTAEEATVTFPNGCHVCEVEIDPTTGVIQVVRYTMVNDIGTVINPLLAEGQLHGGVVQGIGQALLERVVYDEDGQLLSGSFMDYSMPRADNAPRFVSEFRPVPTKTNPLGVKGVGEAGCAGSMTSVMSAVGDALAQVGAPPINMPATPEVVWRAIREASGT